MQLYYFSEPSWKICSDKMEANQVKFIPSTCATWHRAVHSMIGSGDNCCGILPFQHKLAIARLLSSWKYISLPLHGSMRALHGSSCIQASWAETQSSPSTSFPKAYLCCYSVLLHVDCDGRRRKHVRSREPRLTLPLSPYPALPYASWCVSNFCWNWPFCQQPALPSGSPSPGSCTPKHLALHLAEALFSFHLAFIIYSSRL